MARIWQTGFELQSITNGVEYDKTTTPASCSISTTVVNPSGGAASFKVAPSATTGFITHAVAPNTNVNDLYFRFWFRVDTMPTGNVAIFETFASGGAGLTTAIRLQSTGVLILLGGSGAGTQQGSASSTLSTGTWYRVELYQQAQTAAATAVTCTAYLNGVQFATGTGFNSGTGFNIDTIKMGAINGTSSPVFYFDDLSVNDNSGSANNGLPGDGRVVLVSPTGAGDSNTFPTAVGGTAGTSNNYTRVNEIPPDDATSYNLATAVNQSDFFTTNGSSITASSVTAVSVSLRYGQVTLDTSSSIQVQIMKTSGGTIAKGTAQISDQTTWATDTHFGISTPKLVLAVDPDGSAWTNTTLASMQIGYTQNVFQTHGIRVTAVWAYVDFVPGTGSQTISPTGVASTLGIGAPSLSPGAVSITPSAISSTLGIGAPTLVSATPLNPTGIASTLAIGSPALSPGAVTISPTGIAPTSALGAPTLTPGGVTITATGIAPTSALGAPTLSSTISINATGIGSVLALGAPVLSPGAVSISPTGIGSTLAIGAPSLGQSQTISPSGISSTLSIGSPVLSPGAVTINPAGLASTLAIGSPSLAPGAVTLSPSGIASTAALGIPTLSQTFVIRPTGIASTLALGVPTVLPGGVTITVIGIASSLSLGLPTVTIGYNPVPDPGTGTYNPGTPGTTGSFAGQTAGTGSFTPQDNTQGNTYVPDPNDNAGSFTPL